jgi:hypothetical protein
VNNHTPDSKPVQLELFSDAVQIPLTRGYVALVDPCDADLASLKWGVLVNPHNTYATRRQMRKAVTTTYLLHRVVMERIIGRSLTRYEFVDHINHVGLDCRRSNLRVATPSQNVANSRSKSLSKTGMPKGVRKGSGTRRFVARIKVNYRCIHLGYFDTPEEAHAAYVEAARKYFGEFANDGTGGSTE